MDVLLRWIGAEYGGPTIHQIAAESRHMTDPSEIDDSRRDLLVRLLAAGAFALTPGIATAARLLGAVPGPLPAGRSVHAIEGDVRVNGRPADLATIIGANDIIETGANGRVVYVTGRDAFLLRGHSRLEMVAAGAEEFVVGTLRLVSGRLLSVFGKSRHEIRTATATIGIRGTGVYVEADPQESYVCTCYGTTTIAAADGSASETVTTTHHDAAKYVLAPGANGERIRAAPFKNHSDEELTVIEALVGRVPPFELPGDAYGRPRRNTY
jgi:hypothetical protein